MWLSDSEAPWRALSRQRLNYGTRHSASLHHERSGCGAIDHRVFQEAQDRQSAVERGALACACAGTDAHGTLSRVRANFLGSGTDRVTITWTWRRTGRAAPTSSWHSGILWPDVSLRQTRDGAAVRKRGSRRA